MFWTHTLRFNRNSITVIFHEENIVNIHLASPHLLGCFDVNLQKITRFYKNTAFVRNKQKTFLTYKDFATLTYKDFATFCLVFWFCYFIMVNRAFLTLNSVTSPKETCPFFHTVSFCGSETSHTCSLAMFLGSTEIASTESFPSKR